MIIGFTSDEFMPIAPEMKEPDELALNTLRKDFEELDKKIDTIIEAVDKIAMIDNEELDLITIRLNAMNTYRNILEFTINKKENK